MKDPKNPSMVIRTPEYRLRVFVSSTLKELAEEREAVRQAILQLRLTPVMFELGARLSRTLCDVGKCQIERRLGTAPEVTTPRASPREFFG